MRLNVKSPVLDVSPEEKDLRNLASCVSSGVHENPDI